MLIDAHCHLQFKAFKDDYDKVINRCSDKDMILNIVGTQKDTSRMAVEFAEKYDFAYATVGIHPIHTYPTRVDEEEGGFESREEDFDEAHYGELLKSEKVIAIGEAGLDLYRLPEGRSREEVLKRQKSIFLKQINFANEHNLPIVMHCRNAHNEMAEFLNLNVSGKILNGVIHCFDGDWNQAKRYLDIGLYLGFTGIITFPPKKTDPARQINLVEAIKKIPLDRILAETDAPYLAPDAYRGKRCEPWMVQDTIEKIAEIKNLGSGEVRDIINKNSMLFFKMDCI